MATMPDGERGPRRPRADAGAAGCAPQRPGSSPWLPQRHRQLLEGAALGGQGEAVEVAGAGGRGVHDDVHIVDPGVVGVELRRLGGVVGMAVPEADDVETTCARLAV